MDERTDKSWSLGTGANFQFYLPDAGAMNIEMRTSSLGIKLLGRAADI